MNGVTVTYQVKFGKTKAREKRPKPRDTGPSRIARQLALAHYVERLVADGIFNDYSEVARVLSVTRSRMGQVVNLLNLSVPIQEAILVGELAISERELRSVLREGEWERQGVGLNDSASVAMIGNAIIVEPS